MVPDLIVILDDRDPVADSVLAAIGNVRFSDIIRRRRRLIDDLALLCEGADEVIHLTSRAQALGLVERFQDRNSETRYLRIPLCLVPQRPEGVTALISKARFALEPLLASEVNGDEAVILAPLAEMIEILRADQPDLRRNAIMQMADRVARSVDHADFTDIRKSRNLMRVLSGATEARQFNVARADGGVFRKQSADIAKMKAEYDFFRAAPPEMQRFLMPTFGYWERDGLAGYDMENLTVPDAALQFVHGTFGPDDFQPFLDGFFAFLDSRRAGPADPAATLAAGRQHILGKQAARLEQFLESGIGKRVNGILAQGGPRGDLRDMAARAVPLIEEALRAARAPSLVFSHGDPCFSNILYDRRMGLMRLVDPKGFGPAEGADLHPLYDLAKFSHSVLGGYDFVNNGLFRSQLDPDLRLELEWTTGGPPDWAAQMFRARVAATGQDIRHVRAVELSLFLSMLPLHSDRPEKLVGFALIAGHILDELEKG